jgi:hypothetical protein
VEIKPARPGPFNFLEPTLLHLALTRWHRWLVMLESGRGKVVKPLRELARREGMDSRYVSLATDIVAAILDETLPPGVTLFDMPFGTPPLWEHQRNRIKGMMPRSRIGSCR